MSDKMIDKMIENQDLIIDVAKGLAKVGNYLYDEYQINKIREEYKEKVKQLEINQKYTQQQFVELDYKDIKVKVYGITRIYIQEIDQIFGIQSFDPQLKDEKETTVQLSDLEQVLEGLIVVIDNNYSRYEFNFTKKDSLDFILQKVEKLLNLLQLIRIQITKNDKLDTDMVAVNLTHSKNNRFERFLQIIQEIQKKKQKFVNDIYAPLKQLMGDNAFFYVYLNLPRQVIEQQQERCQRLLLENRNNKLEQRKISNIKTKMYINITSDVLNIQLQTQKMLEKIIHQYIQQDIKNNGKEIKYCCTYRITHIDLYRMERGENFLQYEIDCGKCLFIKCVKWLAIAIGTIAILLTSGPAIIALTGDLLSGLGVFSQQLIAGELSAAATSGITVAQQGAQLFSSCNSTWNSIKDNYDDCNSIEKMAHYIFDSNKGTMKIKYENGPFLKIVAHLVFKIGPEMVDKIEKKYSATIKQIQQKEISDDKRMDKQEDLTFKRDFFDLYSQEYYNRGIYIQQQTLQIFDYQTFDFIFQQYSFNNIQQQLIQNQSFNMECIQFKKILNVHDNLHINNARIQQSQKIIQDQDQYIKKRKEESENLDQQIQKQQLKLKEQQLEYQNKEKELQELLQKLGGPKKLQQLEKKYEELLKKIKEKEDQQLFIQNNIQELEKKHVPLQQKEDAQTDLEQLEKLIIQDKMNCQEIYDLLTNYKIFEFNKTQYKTPKGNLFSFDFKHIKDKTMSIQLICRYDRERGTPVFFISYNQNIFSTYAKKNDIRTAAIIKLYNVYHELLTQQINPCEIAEHKDSIVFKDESNRISIMKYQNQAIQKYQANHPQYKIIKLYMEKMI